MLDLDDLNQRPRPLSARVLQAFRAFTGVDDARTETKRQFPGGIQQRTF